MIKIQRHFVAMYRVHSPTSEATNDEVLNMFNKDINLEYAKISRFNGKVISMGKEGQAICYSEITKRLDETNIDRTAMSLSRAMIVKISSA